MSTLSDLQQSLQDLEEAGFDYPDESNIDALLDIDAEEEVSPTKATTNSAHSHVVPPANSALADIFTVENLAPLFPSVAKKNIQRYLPIMLNSFQQLGMTDPDLVLMAFATVRAETAGFEPISEYRSKYNTTPGAHLFNRYDNRADIGNRGRPDGAAYKGRGFIQLTGRANYIRYGQLLGMGMQLADQPELANQPDIAASLLARFILDKQKAIKKAIMQGNLKKARRLVNGGSHGLQVFKKAFLAGRKLYA